MKCEQSLSDLYQQFTSGNFLRKDFEGMIFKYLLDNPERYHAYDGNLDRWDDFLSWLYPRLVRAIDLYREQGSSFDAYITGVIQGASREYRCRQADHYMTEYVCWQAKAEEMMLCENEPEYTECADDISIPNFIKPRQILYLLLKSYYFVPEGMIEQVAGKIGMKTEAVLKMVDEIKRRRSLREAAIQDFRERVFSQHYRCLAYQKRMSSAQEGTEYHERLKERLERARKRYNTMKKRLGRMRVDPSNRMIAEVIGIPKGTVDSGLFAIKNQMASFVCQTADGDTNQTTDRSTSQTTVTGTSRTINRDTIRAIDREAGRTIGQRMGRTV